MFLFRGRLAGRVLADHAAALSRTVSARAAVSPPIAKQIQCSGTMQDPGTMQTREVHRTADVSVPRPPAASLEARLSGLDAGLLDERP